MVRLNDHSCRSVDQVCRVQCNQALYETVKIAYRRNDDSQHDLVVTSGSYQTVAIAADVVESVDTQDLKS